MPVGLQPPVPVSHVKRTTTALLVASVILLGALFAFLRDSEPRARGHSLSTWLSVFTAGTNTVLSHDEAKAAINEIGEAAIPYLLEKIRARDPVWKQKLYSRRFEILGRPIIRTLRGSEQREQALFGFAVLGPRARAAIPQLAPLLHDPDAGNHAAHALASIGPDAWPTLRTALTNATNVFTQHRAISATSVNSDLETATLPEMRILKTHPNDGIALSAVLRLINRANKEEAEEAAFYALRSGRPRVQRPVLMRSVADWRIDREKLAGTLLPLLKDPDPSVRREVTNAFEKLFPKQRIPGFETNIFPSLSPAEERRRGGNKVGN